MAQAKKKPVAKKSQSVREQSAKQRDKAAQPRRLRQTASTAAKPLRATSVLLKRTIKPFGFLLAPFKTRPARFVGRILSKVLLLGYFKSSWQELRKVVWPGRKQTANLTFAVIMFALAFGLLISVVDYGLDKLFRKVLLQ